MTLDLSERLELPLREATAHGHAALLLNGAYGDGADVVRAAADQASRATYALSAGRDAPRCRKDAAEEAQS